MPLFRRAAPPSVDVQALAKAVAAELTKADESGRSPLTMSLPAGVKVSDLSELANRGGGIAEALGVAFDDMSRRAFMNVPFGPGTPIAPAAIDPIDPATGRTEPRTRQYPVNWNMLLGETRAVPWSVLQRASEVDLVRRCIEIRKADVVAQNHDIVLSEDAIRQVMADTGERNRARASAMARRAFDGELSALQRFWEKPDRLNDLDIDQWTNAAIEELLVTDALSVYPHPTNGRPVVDGLDTPTHSLRLIDGSTIKPLYDPYGNLPASPSPAYQQVLYGFPRGEYSYDPAARGELLRDQLLYRPRNRRVRSPYGFSPVEQALPVVDIWLKREEWVRAEYGFGTSPDTWLRPIPNEQTIKMWTPEQRRLFERALNDDLSGQTVARQLLKILPPGLEPVQLPQFAEKYKPDFDQFIMLLLASFFDVMGTQLNITPKGGLGGKGHQEGEAAKSEAQARQPTVKFLQKLMNSIDRRFLGAPDMFTHTFESIDEDDIAEVSTSRQAELFSGQKTLNDIQAEMGAPLYEFEEADMPFCVVPGSGIIFLEGASTRTTTSLSPSPEPPGGPAPGPPGPAPAPVPAPKPAPKALAPGVEEELRKFVGFAGARIRSGKRWRDFAFSSIDPTEAERLNGIAASGDLEMLKAAVADLPKAEAPPWRHADEIEAHYAPKLHEELKRAIKGWRDVVRARAAHASLSKAADPAQVAAEQAAMTAGAEVTRARLTELLTQLYGDAYTGGTRAAILQLPTGAGAPSWMVDAGVGAEDWSEWEPGWGEAALRDASGGLRQLLTEADITIQSVTDTLLDRLGDTLAQGLANGDPVRTIEASISGLLDNPAQANVIARTETARAMTAAAMDTYRANGVAEVNVLPANGCDLCERLAAEGPYALNAAPEVPVHPNCRCALVPVVKAPQ